MELTAKRKKIKAIRIPVTKRNKATSRKTVKNLEAKIRMMTKAVIIARMTMKMIITAKMIITITIKMMIIMMIKMTITIQSNKMTMIIMQRRKSV